ncbi:hypothetical protein Tco_0938704 [Tanacetum coccineum]|uniref:Uncharacterized protein n=1 Tax=Tanacetum coccineum TaxID=301880 RepID=A0ABQ5DIL3_9ASTR
MTSSTSLWKRLTARNVLTDAIPHPINGVHLPVAISSDFIRRHNAVTVVAPSQELMLFHRFFGVYSNGMSVDDDNLCVNVILYEWGDRETGEVNRWLNNATITGYNEKFKNLFVRTRLSGVQISYEKLIEAVFNV